MSAPDGEARLSNARELLRGFPEGTVEAAVEFLTARSPEALDRLTNGVLAHLLPPAPAGAPAVAARPDSTRLVEELGFDSLAMVEMGFLIDDLLGVRLTDEDMRALVTLGDLRQTLRRRCGAD